MVAPLCSDLVLGIDELVNFSRRFRASKNITFYLTLNDHFNYVPTLLCDTDSDRDILRNEFEDRKNYSLRINLLA